MWDNNITKDAQIHKWTSWNGISCVMINTKDYREGREKDENLKHGQYP